MIRLFHTADLHLGLKFTRGGYAPTLRDRLVTRRLECLRAMVALAQERACQVFVIAGDLFDTPRVAKGLVREAAAILARFEGVIVVLPGNHDYVQGEDPLWPGFVDALGEGHHLLQHETPCDLREQGVPLVLFPGVCASRHSQTNAVGWVPAALASLDLPDEVRRIGVAHGSLEGLSPDFGGDYFPMTKGELEATGLDLWLLGHTHVRFPDRDRFEGDRVLFPATPEPDGFDCRHAGHAWIIELEADGTVRGESVRTGTHRFRTVVKTLANEADLEAVKTEFATFSAEEDLVKLILSGRLPGELFESRGEWLAALEKSVLYLESDLSDLHREIRGTDIGREFTIGSFPQRLLGGLAESGAEADALQLAWDLVKEARS
jgi:DNA repair exonuclease SbcCD nuclease subunit